jgi:hypothetical protein
LRDRQNQPAFVELEVIAEGKPGTDDQQGRPETGPGEHSTVDLWGHERLSDLTPSKQVFG